ncbi:short-chain dehydrogenase/reductase SDR [Flammeovirgaceae bacterium 311]|nr:short-chain dehydrogenase/reductase SDR [Flammeovirgaceae bacterium 311]
MKTFLSKAALATSAYMLGKGLYRYIKEQQFSFEYKVVLITGASRGLGLVMARQLAHEGAIISICASNKNELEEVRYELEPMGASVLTIEADVTAPGAAQRVIEQTVTQYGRLDVLINNAGNIVVGPLQSQTQEIFEQLMQLHFFAPLRFIDVALPHLRQSKGRIMNISSIGGKISVPHLLSYSASKFALTGFSEGLYAELKKEGIIVTTACPGLMRTGSPRNADITGKHEEEYTWFKIGDSLPLLSMDAEKAARKLLNACRRGDPEYILTLPAKLASLAHGISPSMVIRINELVNSLMLPEPTYHAQVLKGHETQFEHQQNPLTKPTDEAARENNQF